MGVASSYTCLVCIRRSNLTGGTDTVHRHDAGLAFRFSHRFRSWTSGLNCDRASKGSDCQMPKSEADRVALKAEVRSASCEATDHSKARSRGLAM